MAKRKSPVRPGCEHVPDTETTLGAWTMVPDPNVVTPARESAQESDARETGSET